MINQAQRIRRGYIRKPAEEANHSFSTCGARF